MEGGGVLKSHPAPPWLPGSPTLARGTGAQHCAGLSSPARPFVSPLFCVNQMPFVRSQTCCVHTHTNIPAQSVGNAAHIQIMRRTLPRPGTRAGGTHTVNSCCPRGGVGIEVQGVWSGSGAGAPSPACPCVFGRCLSCGMELGAAGTSLPHYEFPSPVAFIHPLSWFFSVLHPCFSGMGDV